MLIKCVYRLSHLRHVVVEIVDAFHVCLNRCSVIDEAFGDFGRCPGFCMGAPESSSQVMQTPGRGSVGQVFLELAPAAGGQGMSSLGDGALLNACDNMFVLKLSKALSADSGDEILVQESLVLCLRLGPQRGDRLLVVFVGSRKANGGVPRGSLGKEFFACLRASARDIVG